MQKIKNIALIALAVIVVMMALDKCRGNKQVNDLVNQLSEYKISEKAFKVQREKDSSTIATQTQTYLTQTEALKLGLATLEGKMKKLQSQVYYNSDIYVDSVDVPFLPEHFADTTGLLARYENGKLRRDSIAIPKQFAYADDAFRIGGEVRKEGLHLDSVSIPNKTTVTIGYERKNIFSKLKPVVTIKNTNKYLQVTSMNNVVIKQKKSIFKSKLFWFGVGFVGEGIARHYLKY